MGSGHTLNVGIGISGTHALKDSVSPLPDILRVGRKELIRTWDIWFPLRIIEHPPNIIPLHLK